jgi:hypothetical protein
MPLRLVSRDSFFDPEFVAPTCLRVGTTPWLLAKMRSKWFPDWLFTTWRGRGGRGRDAWPATVLVALIVLRWSEHGMSRRAAVGRASTDLAWRAAMGLELGGKTPSERTVRDFEKFLRQRHADTQVPRYLLLHEHIVRSCLDAGVANARSSWVMDSTPMWCLGAVRDTVRLLGDGLRSLAAFWARATRTTLEQVAADWQLPFLLGKSTKGAFPIEWHDAAAKATVTTQLAEGVVKTVDVIRRGLESDSVRRPFRKGLLRRCRHLLRVVEQDLESGEDGRLVIAQRVAAERLISLTDPQARHGRKSKSQTFDGFKVHLLGDAVSGLILSIAVTSGNVHDGQPAHRLVGRAKALHVELDKVLADTAYGGARLRHVVQRHLGITLLSPPPPVEAKEGKLGKAKFAIDFENARATCPNGITSDDMTHFWSSEHGTHAPLFAWPKPACDECPLSQACRGKLTRGRRLVVHPYERELRLARQAWDDPNIRNAYRERSQGERLINEVVRRGARQARAFGLQAAQLQAHAIATACNLRLLARALAAREAPHQQAAA